MGVLSRWTCVRLVLSGRNAVAGECGRLRLTMTLLGKFCMNLYDRYQAL